MRWLLRFFLLIVFSIGAVLGLFYPWAADNVPGYELGTWRVYDRAGGYVLAEVRAAPSETPLWVTMEVTSERPIHNPEGVIALTMTVSVAGRTIRAETFTLQGVTARVVDPQSLERLYRFDPIKLGEVEDSPYTVVVGPGEDDFPIVTIDLKVEASAIDIDPAVPVVGYAIMGMAGLLFLLTLRRRATRKLDTPPAPKWGRQ